VSPSQATHNHIDNVLPLEARGLDVHVCVCACVSLCECVHVPASRYVAFSWNEKLVCTHVCRGIYDGN